MRRSFHVGCSPTYYHQIGGLCQLHLMSVRCRSALLNHGGVGGDARPNKTQRGGTVTARHTINVPDVMKPPVMQAEGQNRSPLAFP